MCITTLLSNLTVRTTFLKSREGKVPNMLAFHENNVLNAWHCSHPHFVSTLCVGNYNLPNFLLCLFTGWRHFITSTRILQGSACEQGARSIQPNFPEISAQNSMDRFGPTGKVYGSTFWGGPLFPVGPVGILVEWIALRLSVWEKNSKEREGKGRREPVDKHLRSLFHPLVIILPNICQ